MDTTDIMAREKYKDILKFAQKILDGGLRLLEGKRANSLPKAIVLYHYERAFYLLYAIEILCEKGLAREGMIILRSLLNLYINLKWLTTGDIKPKMERFKDFEVIFKYRRIKTLMELGEIPKEEGDKALEVHREKYKEIQKKYGLKGNERYWSGKSTWRMAKDVSLEEDYKIIYSYLSEKEHTGPAAVRDYLDNSRWGYTIVKERPSDEYIDKVVLSALECFLKVKEITLNTFGMDLSNLKMEEQEFFRLNNKY